MARVRDVLVPVRIAALRLRGDALALVPFLLFAAGCGTSRALEFAVPEGGAARDDAAPDAAMSLECPFSNDRDTAGPCTPWQRCYLFVGAAGCGETCTCSSDGSSWTCELQCSPILPQADAALPD
jgi:hypothetical protein